MRRAIIMTATAGLIAMVPLASASAAAPRPIILTCDDGQTYTTLQRPGTPVFKDTLSRAVLVIQSANGTDFTSVPERLRTTCNFLDDNGSPVVAEFLITPGG